MNLGRRARSRVGKGSPRIALAVSVAAAVALVVVGPADRPGARVIGTARERVGSLTLTDLPLRPLLFLDTATAVGTAPSPDDRFLRLLLHRTGGATRELRRVPATENPRFENLIVAGGDVVWTEFGDGRPAQIWAITIDGGRPARRLTGDTGNVMFFGSQYDLVHHDGRVYWTATPDDGSAGTEIRSVALTGGPVRIEREPGEWTMAAWPWLDDGASDGSAATLLRDRDTGRDVTVTTSAGEFAACSPVWCRVLVLSGGGLSRIDVMRPDGSQRRPMASGGVRTGVPDVAILDRFEILAEPGPHSATSGTAGLLLHDIHTGRTAELSPAANDAQSRDGLVWWYAADTGTARWHVLDLRTLTGPPASSPPR